jgi:predicted TIM-barrel fold metal-dependent hydrolase
VPRPVRVTDCHVHINPLWEMPPATRALLGHAGAGQEIDRYLRDPSAFLAYLDRCGVDRAVLVNYVSPEVIGYTERANDWVLDYAGADPARLLPVGSVLPSHPNAIAELERLLERGLRGFKVHPPHQLFAPNDYTSGRFPALREMYALLERRGVPLLVHTGTSVFPGARNRFAQPMLVEDVAIDFPNLRIVLAHGGRPLWMDEALFLVRRFPNVYLDLSSVPPAKIPEYFPRLDRFPDQVVFGSDWPGPGVRDIAENLSALRALPFAPALIERILETNPDRLFPRRA